MCNQEVALMNTIEKKIELKAPRERVWRALTDYREFGEWFRVKLEQPFLEGQVSRGRILNPGYEHLLFELRVVRLEPQSLFAFTWHPYAIDPAVDYSGETPTRVEFRLQPSVSGTLLTLSESGFDTLPAHRRDEAWRMNDGGWQQQLQNIERYVAS
jgi:uncharacterized protein YndB with AHSA1/START domain